MNALPFVQNKIEKAGRAISVTLSLATAAGAIARHACLGGVYKESQQALAHAASMIPEPGRNRGDRENAVN